MSISSGVNDKSSRKLSSRKLIRRTGLGVISAVALTVVCGLLMTISAVATPVVNTMLGWWGPKDSSVAKAYAHFPRINKIHLENLKMPGLASSMLADVTVNPFGVLPGIAWASEVQAEDGTLIMPRAVEDQEGDFSKRLRKSVSAVDLSRVLVFIEPGNSDRTVMLDSAMGSVSSGDLKVEASSGQTRLTFDGNADTSTGDRLTGILEMRGENLAYIARIFALASPETPPYEFKGTVGLENGVWKLTVHSGTVGDTDLKGDIAIDFTSDVPHVDAALISRQLDFDDLAIMFGLPLGTGSDENFGDAQFKAAEAFRTDDKLIPNAKLDLSRLSRITANVKYDAEKVVDTVLRIDSLRLALTLDDRVLRFTEFRAGFQEGFLEVYATLDATRSPPHTDVRGRAVNIPWSSLNLDPYLTGSANGEFELGMDGTNFRQSARTAQGDISAWSTNSRLVAVAAEAAGLDFGEALLVMPEDMDSSDQAYTNVRCAAVTLNLDDGIGTFSPAVIDTEDSLIMLDGTADFKGEKLNIDVRTDAKDTSWGALFGDVSIDGSFRDPDVEYIDADAVLQLTLSGLLGAVSGPLAALPFIEPGGGKDAPCASLLSRAKAEAQRKG